MHILLPILPKPVLNTSLGGKINKTEYFPIIPITFYIRFCIYFISFVPHYEEEIELEILYATNSITQTHSLPLYWEMNGQRRLPIVIGGFEAQAIAAALEK